MSERLISEDNESKDSYNLTFPDDEETQNILYKFSSVYLVILILLGIFLNTKAIASLLEVIKVKVPFSISNEIIILNFFI